MALHSQIPDVRVLLSLAPEELAFTVLKMVAERQRNGLFRPDAFTTFHGAGITATPTWGYGPQHESDVELAFTEAWRWLEFNMFILPAAGTNGRNGWFVLGRRGRAILTEHQFADYRKAASFPRELLHPAIAADVWISLARGEFDVAVFHAFRAVEEAVRKGGGFDDTDIGVPLMRMAFHAATGPLRRTTDPTAEREALANLFAGAIGSYKNPRSHRTVALRDASEAQEMVMLASHLLRIVDARVPDGRAEA